jgi:hypothetical protein
LNCLAFGAALGEVVEQLNDDRFQEVRSRLPSYDPARGKPS